MSRTAVTSVPISPTLAQRWSPRAYDPSRPIPAELLTAALEAARWAPSANNSQPWRFIVGTRGTDTFDAIRGGLLSFNQAWTENAGALVLNIVDTQLAEGQSAHWHDYDLGQSVAFLVAQANRDGLHARQMGGIDAKALLEAFGLDPARYRALTVVALGYLGDAEALPEPLRERELAPRQRKDLDEIVLVRD